MALILPLLQILNHSTLIRLAIEQLRRRYQIMLGDFHALLAKYLIQLMLRIPKLARWHRVLDAHARYSLIDKINRLVWHVPINDVTVRQVHRELYRLVRYRQTMVVLELLLNAA